MTLFRPAAALLIALSIAACSKKSDAPVAQPSAPTGPVVAVAPPAGKAWTDVSEATPEGGIRLGNPRAPIRLVEYASLTCPHCRDFTADAADPLKQKYVSTGKVSWEYRPFILNSLDIAAFLLARCRGPEPFFPLMEQTYAGQNDWVGAYFKQPKADIEKLARLDPTQMFVKMAQVAGLDTFYQARGLTAAQANKCLSDVPAAEALATATNNAQTQKNVNSTPTLFLNDTVWEAPRQAALWPQLDERLAQLTK